MATADRRSMTSRAFQVSSASTEPGCGSACPDRPHRRNALAAADITAVAMHEPTLEEIFLDYYDKGTG
jgi:hypothetical protein